MLDVSGIKKAFLRNRTPLEEAVRRYGGKGHQLEVIVDWRPVSPECPIDWAWMLMLTAKVNRRRSYPRPASVSVIVFEEILPFSGSPELTYATEQRVAQFRAAFPKTTFRLERIDPEGSYRSEEYIGKLPGRLELFHA